MSVYMLKSLKPIENSLSIFDHRNLKFENWPPRILQNFEYFISDVSQEKWCLTRQYEGIAFGTRKFLFREDHFQSWSWENLHRSVQWHCTYKAERLMLRKGKPFLTSWTVKKDKIGLIGWEHGGSWAVMHIEQPIENKWPRMLLSLVGKFIRCWKPEI